jgi:hypothetical protein
MQTEFLFDRETAAATPRASPAATESPGVVFTRPWVVELILDLAGYQLQDDLATKRAIEPAAGAGAFLVPMAVRLIRSCQLYGRKLNDSVDALLAYELDAVHAEAASASLEQTLVSLGLQAEEARVLVRGWIRTGDYLRERPLIPPADFVIGNPPYIRLEEIPASLATVYRNAYPTMKGRADLYIAFFEAALRQLKPSGVCAFICADRWMRNQYGAELRRLISQSFGVEYLIEMHEADAFDLTVNAYPAITLIRRAPQGPAVIARAGMKMDDVPANHLCQALVQRRTDSSTTVDSSSTTVDSTNVAMVKVDRWFSGSDPWPCVSLERLQLLNELEACFAPLESRRTSTLVGIGVATGLDEIFITQDSELVEPERLLPLAMARDLHSGRLQWSGRYLVNPWDEHGLVCLADYPRMAAHFERHRARLQARHTAQAQPRHWYKTIDRVTLPLLKLRKLYLPDIKGRILPVLDEGTTYPHHNLYCVHSLQWDLEVLGGLLLSDVAQFFVECYSVRMRGGYLRFQAQYLRRIRVPEPENISASQAETLRQAFRCRDVDLATDVACDIYRISPTRRAYLAS